MYQLLFLEFIGTTELVVVLLVALVVFGPRKLPELGRSLGQALQQLRSASEDFKRTWETEVQGETRAVTPVELPRAGRANLTADSLRDTDYQDMTVDVGTCEASAKVECESHDAAGTNRGDIPALSHPA